MEGVFVQFYLIKHAHEILFLSLNLKILEHGDADQNKVKMNLNKVDYIYR